VIVNLQAAWHAFIVAMLQQSLRKYQAVLHSMLKEGQTSEPTV
jgi:hypothetical protein